MDTKSSARYSVKMSALKQAESLATLYELTNDTYYNFCETDSFYRLKKEIEEIQGKEYSDFDFICKVSPDYPNKYCVMIELSDNKSLCTDYKSQLEEYNHIGCPLESMDCADKQQQ